jgi:hypothetical protein
MATTRIDMEVPKPLSGYSLHECNENGRFNVHHRSNGLRRIHPASAFSDLGLGTMVENTAALF